MGLNSAPQARRPGKDSLPFANGFAPATGNMISKLIFHECSVPFQLYIETFIPCFIKMVITIITWDIDDIIRNWGKAVAEPPGRRGSKGRRHIHRTAVTPHLTPRQATASNALNHVLKWSEPLEKIGYLMLLYHATEEFSRDWMGAMYGFEHCGRPESEGPFQRHCDEQAQISNGAPQHLGLPHLDQNRASWGQSPIVCGLPIGHFSVTFEVTFRNIAINAANFRIGFTAPLTFQNTDYWSSEITLGPGASGACIIQADIWAPTLVGTTVTWLTESTPIPVGCIVEGGSISIYQFQPGR